MLYRVSLLERVITDRMSQLERVIADRVSQLETVIADRVSQLETVIAGFRSRRRLLDGVAVFASLHLLFYLSCQGVPVRESNVIQIVSVWAEYLLLFSSCSQVVIKRSSKITPHVPYFLRNENW